MSGPGFFGKLALAGDFVARRLPPGFVRAWDPWCARHLAPRPDATWPAGGLRFFRALPGLPAITGLVLPSADRAGRRFPLTLAAPAAGPAPEPWYDALAAAGAAAAGRLDPDTLEARLAALPMPPGAAPSAAALLLWTAGGIPAVADVEVPLPVLDALLAGGPD